ncbi:MAG: HEPN domain-containing protein [Gracilibacteraceae bacterium]|jgi:HEPN domain-containing protein|nr:HEPN domain-containing protein [Gracilibacteraceae bacterium]
MSKLFGKGSVCLENAINNWKKSKTDDKMCEFLVDSACFNLQQSMEFFLKGFVQMQGQQYVKNHDLRAQINKLDFDKQAGLSEICDEIRTNASTFNSWETDSRYKDSFVTTVDDVQKAISICQRLEELAGRIIHEIN